MKTIRLLAVAMSMAGLVACQSNALPDTSAHQQARADQGQAELDRNIDRQESKNKSRE